MSIGFWAKRPENISRVKVKIRYKADFAWAALEICDANQIHVRFEKTMRDITQDRLLCFIMKMLF